MSSHDHDPIDESSSDANVHRGATEGTVRPLLDAVFGFFVWFIHLLVIYIAVAVSCGFGLVRPGANAATGLVALLIAVTSVAAFVVGVHALRRWRQLHGQPERRFRLTLTIGCDAIAAVGILWQLLAIGVIPPCA